MLKAIYSFDNHRLIPRKKGALRRNLMIFFGSNYDGGSLNLIPTTYNKKSHAV